MSDVSKVLVGSIDSAYVVLVLGRGTMEYCSDLFDYLSDKLNDPKITNVYFELSQCEYLDSSFIGVIVSIQKKLQKMKNTNVILLNPSDKVSEILSIMGLSEILPVQMNNDYKNMEADKEIIQKLDKNYKDIQLLLESHQSLMELNSDNKKRFSLVEEMLKKELERHQNE